MRFRKGTNEVYKPPNAGAGRPKGALNKVHKSILDNLAAIDLSLEETGKGLEALAKRDPTWYFENFYKPRIPKNVTLEGSLGLEIEIFIGPKKVS